MTDAGPSPARVTWLLLALVTLAGLVVRVIPVALADFPVNDGGLFVAMTRGIRDAGWGLPDTVVWNGIDLPFSYPPLGFYLAGLLEAVGADLLGVFRWLPLLTATLIETGGMDRAIGKILMYVLWMGIYAVLAGMLVPSVVACREAAEACEEPFQSKNLDLAP